MKVQPLANAPVQTEYFPFKGGLNQTTPALQVPAGSLLAVLNYEPDINGGYSRTLGYERFDGRARPSQGVYTLVAALAASTGMVAVPAGTTVTIGGFTAIFVAVVTGGIQVVNITGTLVGGEAISVGGTPYGNVDATPFLQVAVTTLQDATYRAAAANALRTLIAQPGSGSLAVRAIFFIAGSFYCIRDIGAAALLYRATTSGWTNVPLGEEVTFTNANVAAGVGTTLTQGGTTATITKVILQSGSFLSGVNTGRYIISGRVGNFAGGAATTNGGGTVTLGGIQTAITLTAGGTYEVATYNFGGRVSQQAVYVCNGIDRAFEFNGTVVAPITTGSSPDAPAYIRGHRGYLWLAIGSSIIASSPGLPFNYVAADGAFELPVGDNITGLLSLPGQALGIFGRNSLSQLLGASAADFDLQIISSDTGAVPHTAVVMGDAFMLDDRGITSITATQAFGNFEKATLSRVAQPTVDALRGMVLAAHPVRQRNQYRVVRNDGQVLLMYIDDKGRPAFTPLQYSFTPTCVAVYEDADGNERIFYGSSDGWVYEIGVGSSFDGTAYQSFAKIYYQNSRSPRVRKRYRRMVLELDAVLYAQIAFTYELSYADSDVPAGRITDFTSEGAGGLWDIATWDQFFYDGRDVNTPSLSVEGTGINISLLFYSETDLDFGHTLQSAILHFTPRRLQR